MCFFFIFFVFTCVSFHFFLFAGSFHSGRSKVTRGTAGPRDLVILSEMKESFFALHFLETGHIGPSVSSEKVAYFILSTGLASPVPHRLHSVISDIRPPNVTESGEAALRRRLASRAIGGYSLTSDAPTQTSLTVFRSSRVARAQVDSKAPNLESLLRSSARSYLVRTSSVCFVLFLRLQTWKPGWVQPVFTLIQFSSTASVTMWVLSVI